MHIALPTLAWLIEATQFLALFMSVVVLYCLAQVLLAAYSVLTDIHVDNEMRWHTPSRPRAKVTTDEVKQEAA